MLRKRDWTHPQQFLSERLSYECDTRRFPHGRREEKAFGRGIYGSKDVPIRILDGLIVGMILLAVVLTVIFSINGGYRVTFDTRGGGEIPIRSCAMEN